MINVKSELTGGGIFAQRGFLGASTERRDPRSLRVLLDALESSDPVVRRRAVYRVGQFRIDDPRVVPPLLAALKDPSPDFRHIAAWSLGQIACLDALDALKDAAGDKDWLVRSKAAAAAKRVEDFHGIACLPPPIRPSPRKAPIEAVRDTKVETPHQAPATTPTSPSVPETPEPPRPAYLHTIAVKSVRLRGRNNGVSLLPPVPKPQPPPVHRAISLPPVRTRPIPDNQRWSVVNHSHEAPRPSSEKPSPAASGPAVTSDGATDADYSFTGQSDFMLLRILDQACEALESDNAILIQSAGRRAIAVGKELDSRGGLPAMLRLYNRITERPGKRKLIKLWRGIGIWAA